MDACVVIGKFLIAENVSCLNEKLLIMLNNFFSKILYLHLHAVLMAMQQICRQLSAKFMNSSFPRTTG